MAKNRGDNDTQFSFTSDVLGGRLLSRKGIIRQWKFILYLFVLTILYISLNIKVTNLLITQRRNQEEIKTLKADYTSKVARLQNQSKHGTIELRLQGFDSKVQKPQNPAKLVKIPQ